MVGNRLCLGGRAHGADTGASTAGNAGIGVDFELAIALGDGGNGTLGSARATGDALVADRICHCQYLLYYFCGFIIHHRGGKCNTEILMVVVYPRFATFI